MFDQLTDEQIAMFRRRLILAEKSCGTIEKYLRDVRKLQHFLAGAPLSKQNILHFKDYVKERYALTTANSILTAVNSLLSFLKLAHLRVKSLRVDKRIFRNEERELKRTEYLRLLKTAQAAKKRAALLHHADFGGDGDQDKRAEIYHRRFVSKKSSACARQRPREDGAFGTEAVSGIKKILFIKGYFKRKNT